MVTQTELVGAYGEFGTRITGATGYVVSGSDLSDSAALKRLHALGIQTHVGHAASNVKDADAVVTSTAVKADNRGFYLTIERGADDRMRGITVKRTE